MEQQATDSIAFGPILSRRFGRSLGVNNIPAKHCSYSCVYCQVGPTAHTETVRQRFYGVEAVLVSVTRRVNSCREHSEAIDIISFVPDGEPTLDLDLGAEIEAVKALGYPVSVITNGSLLWDPQVRDELKQADIVSIEVDTVDEQSWRRIDRSSSALDLTRILDGIRAFAAEYRGTLVTQTMLVRDVNDDPDSMERVAAFLAEIRPQRVCISVPTRPPADSRVEAPSREAALRTWAIFSASLANVEFLPSTAEDRFVRTGDAAEDLMAALAVHPMTESAVVKDLGGSAEAAAVIEELVAGGKIIRVPWGGSVFLARA